jgi:hypothetical protein
LDVNDARATTEALVVVVVGDVFIIVVVERLVVAENSVAASTTVGDCGDDDDKGRSSQVAFVSLTPVFNWVQCFRWDMTYARTSCTYALVKTIRYFTVYQCQKNDVVRSHRYWNAHSFNGRWSMIITVYISSFILILHEGFFTRDYPYYPTRSTRDTKD